MIDATSSPVPGRFPVVVLLGWQATPGNRWQSRRWEVYGLVAGEAAGAGGRSRTLMREVDGEAHYLEGGLEVALYRDEAESYYHNLMSERPSAFVVCRPDEAGELRAVLVTLSYDEAESYMGCDSQVHRVPLPPELYRWVEGFVLEHYVPEQRKKRKRDEWKEEPPGEHRT
jgi:hypothetical protein